MRVGLNLLYLVERGGGLTRYMTELAAELARLGTVELVAFASRELSPAVRAAPWADAIEWVDQPVDVTHGPPWNALKTYGAQWVLQPWRARRLGLDLLHGPAFMAPPWAPGLRVVVTVPDLIYTRHPEQMDARTRIGMHASVGPTARRADRVIAISQATADDVTAILRVPPDRIDITPLGTRVDPAAPVAGAASLRAEFALGDAPVILCVGQKRAHKNLEALVRALPDVPDAVAAFVGPPTPHVSDLGALAGRLGVADRVRWVDWAGDAELEGLYALAACCCQPSFEEGFGLPVLEALARGVPVACAATGALAEVAGDAAETFDPHSHAAVAAAVNRLLRDPARRAELAERGRARAQRFTWEACARATLQSYERALNTP